MSGAPISLLIAEDSDLIRSGLMRFLDRFEDITVVAHAANGSNAVQLAREKNPDIILMDLHMPGMDGVDATRQIKVKSPQCRVLILSSFSDDDEVYAAFSAGADGYCLKSINMERLYNAIKVVATGVAWLDPAIAERVLRGPLKPRDERSNGSSNEIELSAGDVEVLGLLCRGLDTEAIAEHQSLTVSDLKLQMQDLLAKLASSDRTKAAVLAIKQGLA